MASAVREGARLGVVDGLKGVAIYINGVLTPENYAEAYAQVRAGTI